MGDYIVHRARFFDFQPKAVQSMSYDDNFKKLAISRFVEIFPFLKYFFIYDLKF